MPEVQIASTQVVRKGNFDTGDFYFTIYSFIKNRLGYSFNEDDYAQWEKNYGRDIEFHWTFKRNMEAYIDFKIWMECKFRFLKKVKVKVGNDLKSMDNGEAEINVKAMLITDPGGKWSKHPLLKHFQDFYEKVIHKSIIDDHIARLWEHLFVIEKEVKAFFDIPKLM